MYISIYKGWKVNNKYITICDALFNFSLFKSKHGQLFNLQEKLAYDLTHKIRNEIFSFNCHPGFNNLKVYG